MYISGLAPAKIKEPTFAPGPLLHGNIDCAAIAAVGEVSHRLGSQWFRGAHQSCMHGTGYRLQKAWGMQPTYLCKYLYVPVLPGIGHSRTSSPTMCLAGGTRVTKPVAFGGHVPKGGNGRIRFATPITSR
jgi:hypothetical protein